MAAGDLNDPLSNIPNLVLVDQAEATAAPGAGYGRLEVVNNQLGVRIGTGEWTQLATGVTGSDIDLLERQVAGVGGAASFDFQDISQAYETLILQLLGRSTDNAVQASFLARCNNDSGANYDYYNAAVHVQALIGANGFAQTFAMMGIVSAATAPANYPTALTMTIPGYARTVFYKTFHSEVGHLTVASSGNMYMIPSVGFWKNTAAITRLTFFLTGGSFVEGSVASLYGLVGA